jgi:hypothetical protein
MEAAMQSVAKILVPVALISMLLGGVIGYAFHPRASAHMLTAKVPERKATSPASTPQPTPNDEASVANPSWTRWRPLTDF